MSQGSEIAWRVALVSGWLLAATPALALGLQRSAVILSPVGEGALLSPAGLWCDAGRGYLLVANPLSHQVVVLDQGGQRVHVLGMQDLNFPQAVAASRGGTLWVVGRDSERLVVVPQYDSRVATSERLVDLSSYRVNGRKNANIQPGAIHVDDRGTVYVADRGGDQILVLDAVEKLLFTVRDVRDPCDLWVDRSGRIYVADCSLGGIRVYDDRGMWVRTLGSGPGWPQGPLRAQALVVDTHGRVWALEQGGQRIWSLDHLGNVLFSMGGQELLSPVDLAIDAQDRLYVLEAGANRISVFTIIGF